MCKRIRCSKCVPKKIFSKEEAFSVSPAIVKIHGCKEFWKQNREVECSMVLGRGAKFINIATICHLKGSYSFFLFICIFIFFLFFCIFIFFLFFCVFIFFLVFLRFYLFFGFSAFLFHCFEINFKKFQVSKCIQWASIDVRCTRWEKSEVIGLFFCIKKMWPGPLKSLCKACFCRIKDEAKASGVVRFQFILVKSECERSPPDIFANRKSC